MKVGFQKWIVSIFVFAFCSLVLAGPCRSEIPLFEKVYTREEGKPETAKDYFGVPPFVKKLKVVLQGTDLDEETGKAVVSLNGKRLNVSSGRSSDVAVISSPDELRDHKKSGWKILDSRPGPNEIQVELHGKKGVPVRLIVFGIPEPPTMRDAGGKR